MKLEQKLVKRSDGKEVQSAQSNAEKTNPGDVIEYSAAYANNGKVAVKNLSGVLPIPKGVTYVLGSAKPAAVYASTDGVNFALAPLKRKVRDANGVEKEVAVPLSEYTTLRWSLGTLEPQKQVYVSARMQLNPVSIPETAARSPVK